jgi:hypothetical protein
MMLKKIIFTVTLVVFLGLGINSVHAESILPEWIQNTALWYGQGNVSEQEFINAIEYLINNKIIFLTEKEKDNVLDPVIASDDVIVTKPRINQCSVLYQAYKNVGESQFTLKYKHVTFVKTCVSLYKDPIWKYQGDDRIEKLNERFFQLDQKIKTEKQKLSYEPSVSILSHTDIGQGKYLVKFNICAGDKSIDKAKVLLQSKIEAIQVGSSKDIPANSCRNYETQIYANNVANIQMSILEQVYTE